jgi:hypothetical protein
MKRISGEKNVKEPGIQGVACRMSGEGKKAVRDFSEVIHD